jgi:hypothetical protein
MSQVKWTLDGLALLLFYSALSQLFFWPSLATKPSSPRFCCRLNPEHLVLFFWVQRSP